MADPDQGKLDAYADEVAGKSAAAGWVFPLRSQNDGHDYQASEVLTAVDRKLSVAQGAFPVVYDADSGWAYVVAPGLFQDVDQERIELLAALGVASATVRKMNAVQLVELRELAFAGDPTPVSGESKGSAAVKAGRAAGVAVFDGPNHDQLRFA